MSLPRQFGEPIRQWFTQAYEEPTPAQLGAWDAIASDHHTLVVAPTGSGKTLAAFLWALDKLVRDPTRDPGTRVLYVSPLKALAVDIDRNLKPPLMGISRFLDGPLTITTAIRTGDTPPAERRRQASHPPDLLITTPESLYLLLTSKARRSLGTVTTVIIDEIHAIADNKRGSHLAISLERLEELTDRPPQRIGLSATVRPTEVVARFLGGHRSVRVVEAPRGKALDLRVVVPVPDLTNPPETPNQRPNSPGPSVWPHVEESIVDAVSSHRSTLVFTNSRRLAERLTTRLNEIWAQRMGEIAEQTGAFSAAMPGASGLTTGAQPVLARAHHGSVSREQRRQIEDDLKAGLLRAVVATSSLELGIDMGAIDLVIQVQTPPGVASGLQRVGRAGHQVDATSSALLFPTHRGDLLASAVTLERMKADAIELLSPPRHPLDVLAQQVIAMVSMDDWDLDALFAVLRRSGPYAQLPQSAFESVLDMLAGKYPSEDFAALRPRLTWDRAAGVLRARPGAHRIAVTSGGTIPDRGHFGVFLTHADQNSRVGELDEEMVYESRVGDVIALGSTSWRIEDITPDRVLVTPAPGQAARLPFWHGDAIGRPAELGEAIGGFVRRHSDQADGVEVPGLDELANTNLSDYLSEQRAATDVMPTDKTIVVEEFTDEIGDRRIAIHSPWGARVHSPWALVIADRLRERFGIDAQVMPADDGIVLRLPEDESPSDYADLLVVDPDEVAAEVTRLVTGSALFASRFRECAARSLLFPRRDPTRRSPLWQQRQRASQLLSIAAGLSSFPVVLETVRECLQDVYDLPALTELMRRIASHQVAVVEVRTPRPSPFARSLMFGYVAQFLYEGDSPLAERKSAALALDDTLLSELLGTADLRTLLDQQAITAVEQRLQHLGERSARDVESAWDIIRTVGPLRLDECAERGVSREFLEQLRSSTRVFDFERGRDSWVAITEDAARLREALGVDLPVTIPEALLDPVPSALRDLALRYAKTHGPFTSAQLAGHYKLGAQPVRDQLADLAASGAVLSGAFLPDGTGSEWCHPESLRAIRRASSARYLRETEPVSQEVFAAFTQKWHAVARSGSSPKFGGADGLLAVVDQLAGTPLPASQLETLILPARVRDYAPAMLDDLTSSGEVRWWGISALPHDGWVALAPTGVAEWLLPPAGGPDDGLQAAILELLRGGGGWFAAQIHQRLAADESLADVERALWRLTWSSNITNDTVGPLRAALSKPVPRRTYGRRRPLRAGTRLAGSRWSALPDRVGAEPPTPEAYLAWAQALLDRHGVLTRGAVLAERQSFQPIYRALAALEDRGRCRRGYVVDGLGGAQFARAEAVDRLRALDREHRPESQTTHVLAAADPANPFGAALAWPPSETAARPGRKAGSVVVLVNGRLVFFVESGGGSMLAWPTDDSSVEAAASALIDTVHARRIKPVALKRINGRDPLTTTSGRALLHCGAHDTPSGLRIRA
ncbi:MAG: ATP-dependent helicase [Candidatus Nanopelagicales bacterium]|nr:ATP-dependent helicase [Candidatus Nanopelagicales bacterium]